MNKRGIELFLEKVQIGDLILIRSTAYGDMTYQGIVQKITDSSVWVKRSVSTDLFETLAVPALEEFKYEDIWWYDANRLVEVITE